jgi:hypothetical protein
MNSLKTRGKLQFCSRRRRSASTLENGLPWSVLRASVTKESLERDASFEALLKLDHCRVAWLVQESRCRCRKRTWRGPSAGPW